MSDLTLSRMVGRMAKATTTDVVSLNDARAFRVFPGGTTRGLTAMFPPLPRVVRGSGYTVTGESGRRWIDLNNNFTALIHGHAHPNVVTATVDAVRDGSSFGMPTTAEIDLAELLLSRLTWADKVRFCNSGTEAVMTALRLSRAATGRTKVVLPTPSYHGSADPMLVALGDASSHGVPDGVRGSLVLVPPADPAALDAAFAEHGGDLAVLVLDLVPARSGARPLEHAYVQHARELTRRYGALLLIDEVVSLRHHVSGMAAGHYGIEPDLTTVGKIIGGGLPVGALLGTEDLMAHLDPRIVPSVFHGGTFSGNPATMRAGLAAMQAYDVDAVKRLVALGDRLRARLLPTAQALGWDVTGFGSSIKFVHREADEPPNWRERLWWEAQDRGVLLIPGQLSGCLSSPMTEDVVDGVAERLNESLAAVARAG